MWSDHAFSSDARPPASLSLEVVYAAEADASFDALKAPAEDRRSAVFRTVSGEGEIQLVSDAGSVEAPIVAQVGSALFLDFHRVRRYRPQHGAWRFWFFEYEGDELPFPRGHPFPVGDAARDEADARECLEWLRDERPSAAAYASALFTAMVHRWLVAFQAGSGARDSREPHIREAVAEMRRSLGQPISIPSLAAHVGMSERAFRNAFQSVMDWSPKRYFDRLRLEKAAEILRQNRYSIGEIADQLGYSSPFHFSRAFRELFGLPPSTYAAVIRREDGR
jgi:AraC-like DNA-binding protein